MATIGVPRTPVSPVYHRGDYNPATQYAINDVVTFQGGSYINVYPLGSVGVAPNAGSNSSVWNYLAVKGDAGPQGLKGDKGDPGEQGPPGPQGQSAITRNTATVTVTAVAPGATQAALVDLTAAYALLALTTSVPARVRLYPSTANADDDADRPVTDEPAADSGLLLEYVTADTNMAPVTPAVVGAQFGQDTTSILISNPGATTSDVTVDLTYLALEATP